ncbi:MAG TPA: alpha-glucan family phosphorylase [Pseudonocardiaceae bacterium]|jgi:starch phosphorylase
MRAVRRLTVRASLPARLAALDTLATNLRWTWHQPTRDLFAAVSPELWESTGGDPLRLLAEVPAGRLAELAGDVGFLADCDAAATNLSDYLAGSSWYTSEPGRPAAIAYFSMEFGVNATLPNYSGGLGVLAGDHLKAASDLGVPLIGVGLLYRHGYFRQSLSAEGWQQEHYPELDPRAQPLTPLREPSGEPVTVAVPMPADRALRARVWLAAVGRVPLLLLDSDVEGNDPDLREVTDRLYGGDQDHRIRQEILAGIGGVRALRRYCELTGRPSPAVFHTNEGHAGFLGLERIRELVASPGLDFDESLSSVRAGAVFTTHTPVPAGIDRFPIELVEHYLGSGRLLPGLPVDRILALGAEDNPGMFNMAHMGLRLAQRANGVSRLHGDVSRAMFHGMWPDFDEAEVPIGSITNGVHGPTWAAPAMQELIDGSVPVSDTRLWELRCELRGRLVAEVRRRVRASCLTRGASALELDWVDSVFDPAVLTVGFARRAATYKRLTLMLRDPERLRSLLLDPARPVQLVVAGKSHPADDGGKALIQQIVRYADEADVRHRIVFLPDYDMSMARYLYWGCDVWLNNPVRPLEACGTSGMKSALNGGLNLSIRDGWWDECYDGRDGWAIPTADDVADPNRRDDLEASALYELLDRQVLPPFYERTDGLPVGWLDRVRHTLLALGPRVRADRMVREYVDNLYVPAGRSAAATNADGFRGARSLADYRNRLRTHWARIRVADLELADADSPLVGTPVRVCATIEHGELAVSEFDVEAVFGRVDENGELFETVTVPMWHKDNGRYEAEVPLPGAGAIGYTVRVLPKHDLLAAPAELGRVVVAH